MIPIILGAAALGTAAYGLLKGAEGATNLLSANERGERAQIKHQQALDYLETDRDKTNKLAEQYGKLQLQIASTTVRRFVDFIERTGRKASQSEQEFLDGFDISVQQLSQYRAVAIKAESALGGVVMAGAAASAAYSGVLGLATSVGVASTGAAISGLSGAAATNATLAWLGGGALSAGGGGMALGSLVLGGITVGPALAIGGFVLAGQGEEALTKVRQYEAKINTAIEKINCVLDVLLQVRKRILELTGLLGNLDDRSQVLLDELESHPFNPQQDAEKFQQVALLIKALVEIMKVPVLENNGDLNPATANILAKYSPEIRDVAGDDTQAISHRRDDETVSIKTIAPAGSKMTQADHRGAIADRMNADLSATKLPQLKADQQKRDQFWSQRDLEGQDKQVSVRQSKREIGHPIGHSRISTNPNTLDVNQAHYLLDEIEALLYSGSDWDIFWRNALNEIRAADVDDLYPEALSILNNLGSLHPELNNVIKILIIPTLERLYSQLYNTGRSHLINGCVYSFSDVLDFVDDSQALLQLLRQKIEAIHTKSSKVSEELSKNSPVPDKNVLDVDLASKPIKKYQSLESRPKKRTNKKPLNASRHGFYIHIKW